ncbi:peptidase C39 family protein, partial [Candidatus Gracilibacteria bacterium]|nr:peptidase C39 family protein [Candidatus Gracilibacteria bacterium]
MVLAYWQHRTADPRLVPFTAAACVPQLVAPAVFDPVYDGTGNWGFNTAYAASLGLLAYVTRLQRLDQLGRWLATGVPVIVSIAWQEGELANAAIPRSPGHLLVVTGLTADTVYTADPAGASLAVVERRYHIAQFFDCWQHGSDGTVYLIHPPHWPVPAASKGDAWAGTCFFLRPTR